MCYHTFGKRLAVVVIMSYPVLCVELAILLYVPQNGLILTSLYECGMMYVMGEGERFTLV